MFYKKFAAVVLSAVLVGAVPCSVLGASDVSSVTDGVVEELSMEDDFSDGADSISALASALADKTVSEVQDYQEAKAEAEVIAQERLEAEAAAEAARKAEEERKAAEEAARKAEEERLAKRQEIVDFALQFVGNPYVYGGTSLTNGADCSGFVMSVFAQFGYELPRVAAAQCAASEKKDVSNIEVGDLVFYGDGGIDHVALYIGACVETGGTEVFFLWIILCFFQGFPVNCDGYYGSKHLCDPEGVPYACGAQEAG